MDAVEQLTVSCIPGDSRLFNLVMSASTSFTKINPSDNTSTKINLSLQNKLFVLTTGGNHFAEEHGENVLSTERNVSISMS